MRHLLLPLLLLVAPIASAVADPVADILSETAGVCAKIDNGVFDPGEALTEIDLTGDGADDLLIDEGRFGCSNAASLYCGSGGCMLHGIVGEEVTSWQATGWHMLDWGQARILLIGRDGGWCGGAGSQVCFEALTWSDGRFLSVMPPTE